MTAKPAFTIQNSSQTVWKLVQLAILILPLLPSFGGVGLLLLSFGIWKQQYRRMIQRPLNWGLAIYFIWLIITACFAPHRPDAFLGLANFLPFFIVLAALSALIQTPAQLRQIAWLLVVPSVPVVVLGLGQMFLGWAGSVHLSGVLGWVLEPKGNPPGRMASVFMYANILAAYLIIVFILGLGLWIEAYQTAFHASGDWKSRLRQHLLAILRVRGKGAEVASLLFRKNQPAQAEEKTNSQTDGITCWLRLGFLSVSVIGSGLALILTDSRNAWTITVLSCLAFALYQGWRWLVAVVVGVAGSVLCAAFGPSPLQQWLRVIVSPFFWARLTDQMYPNRPREQLRITQWQFAWSMTQQRPWTGWGLRNFTPLYQAKMNIWLGHPHNLFLMLTAETGIPATIFFCGLVGWVMAQGVLLLTRYPSEWPQDRLIIFSYLVAFGACTLFNTVDVTLFDFRVNCLGWLLLSAICGVVYKKKAVELSSDRP